MRLARIGPPDNWSSGLDDQRQLAVSGAFAELRYLAVERTSSNPWSVTLAVEPTIRRIEETGGARIRNYELETVINADVELLKTGFSQPSTFFTTALQNAEGNFLCDELVPKPTLRLFCF